MIKGGDWGDPPDCRRVGIYSFEHEDTLQQEDAHGLLVEAIFY
jgi:hypothetical protein